jgi:hypothetical protein
MTGQGNFLTIVFKLMDRGLTGEEIDKGMRHVVGKDWKEIPVSTWFERLQTRYHIYDIDEDRYVEELEALIVGRIKLDEFSRGNDFDH